MMCIKNIFRIKKLILSFFYSSELKVSSHVSIHELTDTEIPINWMAIVPTGIIMFDKYYLSSLDTSIVKYRIYHPGTLYHPQNELAIQNQVFKEIIQPWLWIGGTDKNGTMHSMSDELNDYLLADNHITLGVLQLINPDITNWFILDETFNEVEFPTEGITIKDGLARTKETS
jgi:hypothetical protein